MEWRSLLKLLNSNFIQAMDSFKCKITIGLIAIVMLGISSVNSNELKAIDRAVNLQAELGNFFSQNINQTEWRNLRDILTPFFDLRSTNQNKWEKVWINASELEKERILGYLAQYIIIQANKYDFDFGADNVIYMNKHNSKDRAVVDTLIDIGESRKPVSVRFRRSKGSWMIYDIFLDEISLIDAWKKLNDAINSSDSFEIVLKKIKSKNTR